MGFFSLAYHVMDQSACYGEVVVKLNNNSFSKEESYRVVRKKGVREISPILF
jgi:hypothetical protein